MTNSQLIAVGGTLFVLRRSNFLHLFSLMKHATVSRDVEQ